MAEVWAKYVDTNSNNWSGAFLSLMGQVTGNTTGVVVDGGGYGTSTSSFGFGGLVNTQGSTGGPKAYLNWLVFDRQDTLIDAGYKRLSSAPKETGQNIAHEKLSNTINITEPGYVYIYLSNEEPTGQPVEVYFDDFKVTHEKGKIVAGGDYYPFGLPIATRQIEAETYRYGYQGQFAEKDSLTNWNTFQLRMYDARFGRWISPDPYGQFASPYLGMGNNPVSGIDPDGGLTIPPGFTKLLEYLSTTTFLDDVVVSASLSPLFALNVAVPTLTNFRTSLSGPAMGIQEQEFNLWSEIGKTVVNGIPNTFKKIGQSVVNSGKFADGMAHVITGGLSPLEEVNNDGERIMQIGGQGMGMVYTINISGPLSMRGSNNFASSTTRAVTLQPRAIPITTTLDSHSTVYAKKRDAQQFNDVCKELGIKDKKSFSQYLHKIKKGEGRGGADHYEYEDLLQIGRDYKADGGI